MKHSRDYASVSNNKTLTLLLFSSEDELSKELQGATAVPEPTSPSQHKPYEVDWENVTITCKTEDGQVGRLASKIWHTLILASLLCKQMLAF
jgi:hypothetical protein